MPAVRGIETCFQQVSRLLFLFKVLKTVFQDTCWSVFSNYICWNCVSQWLHGSQKFTFEFVCVWKNLQPFSTLSVLTSSFLCLKKSVSGHLLNLVSNYIYVSWFVWHPKEALNNPKWNPKRHPKETKHVTLNKP